MKPAESFELREALQFGTVIEAADRFMPVYRLGSSMLPDVVRSNGVGSAIDGVGQR